MQNPETGALQALPAHEAAAQEARGFCVLRIGEVIEIKGGKFRVSAMGRKFIRLEGMPGSYVEPGKLLEDEVTQLRMQLASCGTAATCEEGQLPKVAAASYCDSPALRDVLALRRDRDRLARPAAP